MAIAGVKNFVLVGFARQFFDRLRPTDHARPHAGKHQHGAARLLLYNWLHSRASREWRALLPERPLKNTTPSTAAPLASGTGYAYVATLRTLPNNHEENA